LCYFKRIISLKYCRFIKLDEEIGCGSYGVVKKVLLHGTICIVKDIHVILVNHVGKSNLKGCKKTF